MNEVDPKKGCPPGHWRVRLLVSYDGTDFFGWQRQENQPTVQAALEKALANYFDKPVSLMGASRTDTGVHALGQTAHFDAPRDPTKGDIRFALNGMLPRSIVIRQVSLAPPTFHSIADSVKKTYRYKVLNHRVPSALRHRYTFWVRGALDPEFLNEASAHLVGTKDFKAFQTAGTVVKTTERTIFQAHWEKKPNDIVEFTITGDGFLKQMVRNIVGTLVDLNLKDPRPKRVQEILHTLDRGKAGPTAPPQGLYLSRVYYPPSIDKECRKL